MADPSHARRTAQRFVRALAANGTTTALVFGAHFPQAQKALFEEAETAGLRISSGLVVSDRNLRDDLEVTPDEAYETQPRAARALARPRPPALRRHAPLQRLLHRGDARRLPRPARRGADHALHQPRQREPGRDRLRPASSSRAPATTSTPTSEPACSASAPCSPTTCTSPTTSSTGWRAARTAVAHCPSSNAFLASGIFPMARHVAHGVRFGMGTDVGAGTGLSMLKEGLVAYHVQMIRDQGHMLGPAHLLYLATAAGAEALGLAGHLRRPHARQAGRPRAAQGARGIDARGRARGGAGLERRAGRDLHARPRGVRRRGRVGGDVVFARA